MNDLYVSFSTILELSPILGLNLIEFKNIRDAQDQNMLEEIIEETTIMIENSSKLDDYYFGCLDYLVYEENNKKYYSFLEFNGTTSVLFSTIPLKTLDKMLMGLSECVQNIKDSVPVVMIPISTVPNKHGFIISKFYHERMLIAEYLKRGLQKYFGRGKIVNLKDLLRQNSFNPSEPTIVMGHINEFSQIFKCIDERLCIFEQPISLSIQDRTCHKIFTEYQGKIKEDAFIVVNGIYSFGGNKAQAYYMHNSFIENNYFKGFDKPICFEIANTKEELITKVIQKVRDGKQIVIKPCALGSGKGLCFFLNNESTDEIVEKIESSIKSSEGIQSNNWIYPYTICDFVDAAVIDNHEHPRKGHKFELRIFVYRENNKLKAVPSLVKIAPRIYNQAELDSLMLLNNVSVSSAQNLGTVDDFTMPLNNNETLKTIKLTVDDLKDISAFSVNLIKYVIDNSEILKDETLLTKSY